MDKPKSAILPEKITNLDDLGDKFNNIIFFYEDLVKLELENRSESPATCGDLLFLQQHMEYMLSEMGEAIIEYLKTK